MSEMIQPPIDEYKSRPRPANLPYWIECFLHHHKNRNVPRNEIIEAALIRHYSRDQVLEALNFLKHDFYKNHIACFWEAQDRTEYWRWCDTTVEQHAQSVADSIWFESLPDRREAK